MEVARSLPIIVAPPLAFELAGRGRGAARQALHRRRSAASAAWLRADAARDRGGHRRLAVAAAAPRLDARRPRGAQVVRLGGADRRRGAADAARRRRLPARAAAGAGGGPAGRPPAGLVPDAAGGRHRPHRRQRANRGGFTNIGFDRDAVLFALPVRGRLPAGAGLPGAGRRAGCRTARAGRRPDGERAIVSEDIVHGLRAEPAAGERAHRHRARGAARRRPRRRMACDRRARPIRCGSSCGRWPTADRRSFPVLLLSIWWKRTTAWGAHRRPARRPRGRHGRHPAGRDGRWTLPSVLAGAVGLPAA